MIVLHVDCFITCVYMYAEGKKFLPPLATRKNVCLFLSSRMFFPFKWPTIKGESSSPGNWNRAKKGKKKKTCALPVPRRRQDDFSFFFPSFLSVCLTNDFESLLSVSPSDGFQLHPSSFSRKKVSRAKQQEPIRPRFRNFSVCTLEFMTYCTD